MISRKTTCQQLNTVLQAPSLGFLPWQFRGERPLRVMKEAVRFCGPLVLVINPSLGESRLWFLPTLRSKTGVRLEGGGRRWLSLLGSHRLSKALCLLCFLRRGVPRIKKIMSGTGLCSFHSGKFQTYLCLWSLFRYNRTPHCDVLTGLMSFCAVRTLVYRD